MIWEVGSQDLRKSKGRFRAEMFAHQSRRLEGR
jgi:hypothetical protein